MFCCGKSAAGGIRVVGFYARRARRILPMALLVIVVSTLAVAIVAPHSAVVVTASDGRWSALFLANFHSFAVAPGIITTRPPSPFQQYWSLAIEEQFYLVYPALFIGLLSVPGRWSVRTRLAVGIGAVVVSSFIACVLTSHIGNLYAYDSPLTRAWELGIGALAALGTGAAERIKPVAAATMTWIGLAAILVSAGTISLATIPYPGWVAAVPVLGTALVIVGGSAVPSMGAESVLGTVPFRRVGQWSYSWYLWHWPLLVIAAEAAHTTVLRSSIAKNVARWSFWLWGCRPRPTVSSRTRSVDHPSSRETTSSPSLPQEHWSPPASSLHLRSDAGTIRLAEPRIRLAEPRLPKGGEDQMVN